MKFIAIATLAVVTGGATAGAPQRKRSIENKYVTSYVVEEKFDPYLGLSNRKLEKDKSMPSVIGTSYCTYSPDKTCYVTGWPACCEDEGTCPEERPECDIEYDACADFDTLSAAEEACTEKHECGELEDVNFGPDCAGNKDEHCTEIKACPECEEEIRAMFDCEHGEKCGEGLGACEVDTEPEDHMDGTSYCTYSPDKTCYATGWPACCEDGETCPEERPECDVEYDACADFDTLKAAEEACNEKHECGELEDVNFGPDCAGNKDEHCTEIKACPECEEEIRAMFDCEHGEKCGEGLGACDVDNKPGIKNGATTINMAALLSTVFLSFAIWVSI